MSKYTETPAIHERKGHTPGPWLYRPEKYDDWWRRKTLAEAAAAAKRPARG